ncbi:hypothetical protein NDU88_003555 [Pleurodeles waltl]|uniref:Uncharacterized protein n=1 Tax=Pleurodeles waltl TaxID=8319 RepID=A0AAV7M5Q2_PLEWA|nr:hypothetical protein NDU88_003555 [Pleurodeles waltl]
MMVAGSPKKTERTGPLTPRPQNPERRIACRRWGAEPIRGPGRAGAGTAFRPRQPDERRTNPDRRGPTGAAGAAPGATAPSNALDEGPSGRPHARTAALKMGESGSADRLPGARTPMH